jgi:hypothetical protein
MALYNNPNDGIFIMLPDIPEDDVNIAGWDLMYHDTNIAESTLIDINNGIHRMPLSFSYVKSGEVEYAIIKTIEPLAFYKITYSCSA